MSRKGINKMILFLLIFLVVLTGYLSLQSFSGSDSTFCLTGEGAESSCKDVQNTVYGYFLGIEVYIWGFVAFSILLAIHIISNNAIKNQKEIENVFFWLTFLGALIALFFISVQLFVLIKTCSVCMLIDGTMILVFILSLINRRR